MKKAAVPALPRLINSDGISRVVPALPRWIKGDEKTGNKRAAPERLIGTDSTTATAGGKLFIFCGGGAGFGCAG